MKYIACANARMVTSGVHGIPGVFQSDPKDTREAAILDVKQRFTLAGVNAEGRRYEIIDEIITVEVDDSVKSIEGAWYYFNDPVPRCAGIAAE